MVFITYMCCFVITDLEFEHRRKRRRLLREPSVSPVTVDDSRQSDDGSVTFPPYSSALRETGVTAKELLLKAAYLSSLGLQPCDSHMKQSKLL